MVCKQGVHLRDRKGFSLSTDGNNFSPFAVPTSEDKVPINRKSNSTCLAGGTELTQGSQIKKN